MAQCTEEKTVLELDLVSYTPKAGMLEENLGIDALILFENQIQGFINYGLDRLDLDRDAVVLGTSGDNAIIVLHDVLLMHSLAQMVHQETFEYNQGKLIESAKRYGCGSCGVRILCRQDKELRQVRVSKERVLG